VKVTEQGVMGAVARISRRGDEATAAAVAQILGVTIWTSLRWLRTLAEKGLVAHATVTRGQHPSTYRLTDVGQANLVDRPPTQNRMHPTWESR